MQTVVNPVAIILAIVAALVGTALWAAVTLLTGYEIGYVAWAVGGLVGGAAMLGGGRGVPTGVICAGLALVAIFGGKYYTVYFELQSYKDEAIADVTQARYDSYIEELEAFAAIKSESEHPAFMARFEYSESTNAVGVTGEELHDFREYSVPFLEEESANVPDYNTWASEVTVRIEEYYSQGVDIVSLVIENLGPIDLIFGALGVMTAFRLASGGKEEGEEAATEAA